MSGAFLDSLYLFLREIVEIYETKVVGKLVCCEGSVQLIVFGLLVALILLDNIWTVQVELLSIVLGTRHIVIV